MYSKEEIQNMIAEGMTTTEIMRKTGLSYYGVRNHRRNSEVKKRRTDRISEHRRRIKRKAVDYSGGMCLKCEYKRSVAALDFHHLDPGSKDFQISAGLSIGWDRTKAELSKTILFCKNCHSEFHNGEFIITNGMIGEQRRRRNGYIDKPLIDYSTPGSQ